MRIGVISDTHGRWQAMQAALASAGDVAWWLHAGDFAKDAAFLEAASGARVAAAAGNCDGWTCGRRDEEWLEAAGRRIWLVHGHTYGVKQGCGKLIRAARRQGADVVLYGHTHIPEIRREDRLLIVNPGSAALPRGRAPTFAVLELEDGKRAEAKIVSLPFA